MRKMIGKVKNFKNFVNENQQKKPNDVVNLFLSKQDDNTKKLSMGGSFIYNGVLYYDNVINNNIFEQPIAKFYDDNTVLINNDEKTTHSIIDYLIKSIENYGYDYKFVDGDILLK